MSEDHNRNVRHPGPRDGLDRGSMHDLALDGAQVHLEVRPPRATLVAHQDILVPEQATGMVSGLSAYGT